MTNIREKYATEIAAIMADAEANLEEARQLENEQVNEMQQKYSVVTELQNEADTSHKAFFKVVVHMLRLVFMKNPSPEEVNYITQPCTTYMTAAAKLPEAEKALFEAKVSLSEAQEKLYDAEDDLAIVRSLV